MGSAASPIPDRILDLVGGINAAHLTAGLNALPKLTTVAELGSPLNTTVSHITSMFSGWGWPVGAQGAFSALQFEIQPFDSTLPVTLLRCRVLATDYQGTVLADVSQAVVTYQNRPNLITVELGKTINQGATALWIEFYTNGRCGIRQTSSTVVASPQSRFSTQASLSNLTNQTTAGQENYWTRFCTAVRLSNIYESGVITGGTTTADFPVNTSTFSSWGSYVGAPQNFNQIEFDLNAFDSTMLPTELRVRIRENDETGNILGDVSLSISPSLNTPYRVKAFFPSTIANALATNLWLEVMANGRMSVRKTTVSTPSTPVTKYQTIASLNYGSWTNSASQWLTYARFSLADHNQDDLGSPTGAQARLSSLSGTSGASSSTSFAASLSQMAKIYAIEGRETRLYFDNVVKSYLRSTQISFDVTCTKGQQELRRWKYTPVSADAGDITFSLTGAYNGSTLATQSVTLRIKALTAGNGITRKLLVMGDSTTAGGEWLAELTNLFNFNKTSPVSSGGADVMTISTQGHISSTVVDAGGTSRTVKHSAISGKTINFFYTDPTSPYLFSQSVSSITRSSTTATVTTGSAHGMVTGDSVTIAGATQTAYNGTFTITVTGSTTFTYAVAGSPATPATGTITATSFNFSKYLSTNSITLASSDWVFIHLGINDIFSAADDTSLGTTTTTVMAQYAAVIANIKGTVSGIRIGVCLVTPPSSQDAFGNNYDSGQTRDRYKRNRDILNELLTSAYSADANSVYVVPLNYGIDGENDFPTSTGTAGAYNATAVTRQTNGVHPAAAGYYAKSNDVYCFLKGQET